MRTTDTQTLLHHYHIAPSVLLHYGIRGYNVDAMYIHKSQGPLQAIV